MMLPVGLESQMDLFLIQNSTSSPIDSMSDSLNLQSLSFKAQELPFDHVTVYTDRAEIKKTIHVILKCGRNEILISELPSSLNPDSIRVEGRGRATVVEIKLAEIQKDLSEDQKENNKKLQEELIELENEKVLLDCRSIRLKKLKELLDMAAITAVRGCDNNSNQNESSLLPLTGNLALSDLDKLLQYYSEQMTRWDSELEEIRRDMLKIDQKIQSKQKQSSVCAPFDFHFPTKSALSKQITIYVQAVEEGQSFLDLIYIVNNASWEPTYSLRVQSDGEKSLQLIYNALIKQETGEDWKDAKFTLSTAVPFLGGQIPQLGTTKISLYKRPRIQDPRDFSFGSATAGLFGAPTSNRTAQNTQQTSFGSNHAPTEPPATLPEMQHSETSVHNDMTSSKFEIEVRNTIPSDKSLHKVTIAVVGLTPIFEYYAVPSKSTHAYIRAKTTNSSPYFLLNGPVSVFVNGSFVAKGQMKRTACSEPLHLLLGVDPSVKIDYPPQAIFDSEVEFLSKWASMRREQKIRIFNGKTDPIRVTVVEPFPQSTDEKIKVTLIEPSPSDQSNAEISMNKCNNIEWSITINGHETKELILKYQIEYPIGEQLQYSSS